MILSGSLTCIDCRETWRATWMLRAPAIVCHHCGSERAVPVGLQLPTSALSDQDDRTDAAMFAIEQRQIDRTRS